MWLTQEEARMKWCPMARTVDGDTGTINRNFPNGYPPQECLCIASACMMWRERTVSDDVVIWTEGYCSVAGEPYEEGES